jgi:dihydroorotate dehydrogenase electron transfer subunit
MEEAYILDHERVAQHTYRLQLEAPLIAALARPGQFLMARVQDSLDPLLRRPFSFHRIHSHSGRIEILYRVVGRGTSKLSRNLPGSRLNLLGPLGNSFLLPDWEAAESESGPILLVAGGIGIAPLVELIWRLIEDFGQRPAPPLHLFYGARSAAELLPSEFFPVSCLTLHSSTDDGSFGHHGLVTELMRHTVAELGLRPAMLYACGPLAMQYHVAAWALEHRVPTQLSLESLMACGVGACLGCALPSPHPSDSTADHYLHVCKDGPIFAPGAIQWHKMQLHGPPAPIFLYS